MLTPEQVRELRALFAPEQHQQIRGFWYVAEAAVCDRLSAVDPSWEWRVLSITRHDNGVVVVHGEMTVRGVVRHGIGQAAVMTTTRQDKRTGESIAYEANEAEKGAATDALRRAARLFGVGQYLLDMPKDSTGESLIRNAQQLAAWLNQIADNSPRGFLVAAEIEMGVAAGNKPYIAVALDRRYKAIAWSRQVFVDAGYGEEAATWTQPGTYVLSEPCRVYWRQGGEQFVIEQVIKLSALGE